MNEQSIEGLGHTINSFSMSILTNSGFEEHYKLSLKYGHKKNMTKEQLLSISHQLDDLKMNNNIIYTRMYEKLLSLILQDNLNGNISDREELNGTPYALFSRTRDFASYISMMIENKNTVESICKEYEKIN